ncbi:D-glucuronyl C5-epimerase B [Condylostylus longicornis]|uniref:D-glucuronyl C5-epimerase B n=1 Tax=Condylostylus longicornis TaxID=2530218 RepID=UPI00244DB696|nr:D-glucuronyl C5-epimerase B [Condylostylus longicornis]
MITINKNKPKTVLFSDNESISSSKIIKIKSINKLSKCSLKKSEPLFFIIMRLNLKAVLLCLCLTVFLITISVYMRCSDFGLSNGFVPHLRNSLYGSESASLVDSNTNIENIECVINQDYAIKCKRDVNDVYIPFSFIKNYFEVFGTLISEPSQPTNENGVDHILLVNKFMWSHTNSKINIPKGKYDPKGVYMYFENYNVEVRDRVKCVSAAEGVPVSTQWEKRGYFYPTQIAQFGLSHYSKNLTDPEPRRKVLEDADANQMEWTIPSSSNLTRIWHSKLNTTVVNFLTSNYYDSSISYNMDHISDLVLSMDIYLMTNSSSLMVTLQNRETKRTFNLYYIVADLLISVQGENIYYGLGSNCVNQWKHITRDLVIDVQKGFIGVEKKMKIRRNELKLTKISILGAGFFDNLTLSTSDHIANFYDAAEWFVNHQDKKSGGWINPVRRSLSGFQELKPGWLSAMGQGHAISVLARAYYHSGGDKKYLKAALTGLKPFRVLSRDGGVLAKFMGQLDWYEEYPTTPPSFVLNGFIYSLLGLYDLNCTAPGIVSNNAGKLFRQGMISLKKLLLLYDTGSGTSYDLRHFTLGQSPNIARWDYHATHVNQLLLLATIDNSPIISLTAERWKSYMFGKRAKHN